MYARGSTGKIVCGIERACHDAGIETLAAHRYLEKGEKKREDVFEISSWFDCHAHNRIARYTMLIGCFSRVRTSGFVKKIKKASPDIIHLHNLHGNYINLEILFRYIKKNNIPVIWTLHDCWSFTGGCPHFTVAKCDKWKNGCGKCPQKSGIADTTKIMWRKKKEWFMGVDNMTLVTPSKWLAGIVRSSYLGNYPIRVINNGIDLSVFKPTDSDFRSRYGLADKYIVLGVSFGWGERKGLDVFIELSKRLDEKYRIVLVGTDAETDKQLPKNIVSIHRTNDQVELAEIYTAADVFANPTREENYPTVNMESISCGTPVVTFNTGGSSEILDDTCGSVVECNDVNSMEREIRRVCEQRPFPLDACVSRAKMFSAEDRFNEYVKLYEEII